MTERSDCDVFMERLDELKPDSPPEALERLREHAASCAECRTLLRVHEHVSETPLEELEAEVPEEFVEGMWTRVESQLGAGRRRGRAWLVPALAAASVALAVASGYLFREIQALREQERALGRQVALQQRWLAELDLRSSVGAAARTAALGGSPTWQRALARKEQVSVEELTALIAGIPRGTTIVGPEYTGRLLDKWIFLRSTLPQHVLSEIRLEDGLQADEALRLLRALRIPPNTRITTSRILGFTVGARGAG